LCFLGRGGGYSFSFSQLINGSFQPFSVTPWSFNICATLLLKQK
jgi:hypothetical protein